jgi:beta-glucanase (GH16 family)
MYIKATILSLAVLVLSGTSAHAAVVWSDEFDAPDIDTDTWIWDVGGHGFGNGQMEYNTSRATNSFIENGSLVIQAHREDYFDNAFTSARMLTQGRFAYKYGSLEARIKLPNTENGLWPAFWMLGNNFPAIDWPACGEVDIVEMGSKGGIAAGTQQETYNTALHFSNAADLKQSYVAWDDASVDLSLDYHLYKVSWTPSAMTFYLDGAEIVSWDITPAYMAEFHQPHFMVLNLAIGDYGGEDGYTGITTPGTVTATFPARMEVDWVRLEDNDFTEIYLGADSEETGNFGVFTETTPVENALVYGDDTSPNWPYSDEAALYTWNNMNEAIVPAPPSEGTEVWSFDVAGGEWFGMGVFLPNFRNMKNYSDGFLHFDIQTTLTDPIKIGVKSSRGGESWVVVGDATAAIGFDRVDGEWHTVSIPLNGFLNCDFNTVQQIFMVSADGASASTTVSFDNVYWEPSVARQQPSGGSFGVYTETEAHKNAGEYELGVDGEFFIWGDTMVPGTPNPVEGSESINLQSVNPDWFGAAFTPTVKYDLSAFDNPNGKLNFSMKTDSAATFYVGMKSGNVIGPPSQWAANTGPAGVGQVWIKFAPGSDPYGFVRGEEWDTIEIPIADIVGDTDLSQVSQLFQILGVDGPISDIELDDIYYSGGRAFQTNIVASAIQDGVGISWPTTDGSIYTVQWKDSLTNTFWNDVSPTVEGDWTTKTVFDPTTDPERFYQVLEN